MSKPRDAAVPFTQSALATGVLVRHATLGVGKVVALEPAAVHVFFPHADRRYAAKFLLRAAGTLLATGGVERDDWLAGVTSFSLDPVTRRYALAADWVTHDEAIAEFRAAYPRGFLDPAYLADGSGKEGRASRWRAASAEWVKTLGEGRADALLAAGDVRELVRRAVRIGRHVVLAPGTPASSALSHALRDDDAAHAFFEALLALLAVPSPARARFERLFAAAAALDTERGQAWPLATLFPFLAVPAKHVFVAPRWASGAAERLGADLRLTPVPSWAGYAALRALSIMLLAKLEPLGARDLVDVEGFLYATATGPRRVAPGRKASSTRAAAKPAARSPKA